MSGERSVLRWYFGIVGLIGAVALGVYGWRAWNQPTREEAACASTVKSLRASTGERDRNYFALLCSGSPIIRSGYCPEALRICNEAGNPSPVKEGAWRCTALAESLRQNAGSDDREWLRKRCDDPLVSSRECLPAVELCHKYGLLTLEPEQSKRAQ